MDATQLPAGQQIDPRLALLKALFSQGAPQGAAQAPAAGTTAAGVPPAATAVAARAGMTQAAKPAMATPSNPASTTTPSPSENSPSSTLANKTAAAGDPGNTPPAPMNAPALSEAQYNAQNPAPAHTPYKEPGLGSRMLMGLFSGMQAFGKDPQAGPAMLDRYLNQIQQKGQEEKNYPQASADQAHQKYMTYMEGQKAPLEVQNEQQELANRRLEMQKTTDARTLQQQYSDAVRTGDTKQATSLLGAIKDLTGAETKPSERMPTPYADWRTENPHAPVEDWVRLQTEQKESVKGTPPGKAPGTTRPPKNSRDYAVQKELIEKDKGTALQKLESQYKFDPQSNSYIATNPLQDDNLTQRQWQDKKNAIQKEYDDRMQQLGVAPAGAKSTASANTPTPKNASAEVYAADGKTLLGHIVDGAYVPLKK